MRRRRSEQSRSTSRSATCSESWASRSRPACSGNAWPSSSTTTGRSRSCSKR